MYVIKAECVSQPVIALSSLAVVLCVDDVTTVTSKATKQNLIQVQQNSCRKQNTLAEILHQSIVTRIILTT